MIKKIQPIFICIQSEKPARTSLLMLCDLIAKTLKLGLSLLGIPQNSTYWQNIIHRNPNYSLIAFLGR
jgi:hypothetical protein